jgi:putative drug exporter of the RND superfamily
MFRAIAKFSVKFRWPIIILWIAAVPIVTSVFPNIADVTKNSTQDFLPKNSPTAEASVLEQSFQRKDTATNSVIVAERSNGQLTPGDNANLQMVVDKVKKVKEVTEVRDLGSSADGRAHEYFVGISGAAFGQGAVGIVDDIRGTVHSSKLPSNVHAYLTGDLAAGVDQEKSQSAGKKSVEFYSVILILVLLLVVFRSILAPIITLLPAGLALAIAQPVIAESTKAGVKVGFITQILLIVLLLGAGADYGLFLVFRVREEMRTKGLDAKQAVVEALTHVGESITFSAATVIAALLSLMLATFGLYKGIGPALAIGLLIMLLISLTFLPAVLSILGKAVFWPSKTAKREAKFGLWGRLADRAIKKPAAVIALGILIFGGLSLGLIGYKSGGFGNQNAPAGTESEKGQKVIVQHFPAANNNPQLLIFDFKTSVWDNPQPIAKLQTELAASKTFSALSGPLNANGFSLTPDRLKQLHGSGSPIEQVEDQFISPDGHVVQFYAVLKAGTAGSTAAMRAIPSVYTELNKIAADTGAAKSTVYSADSVAYDINQTANRDLKRIIPIVLLIIAALLAILLRSLVAPWYLIASVGLSYLASMGFAMIVFVHIFNQDGLNFVLPFLMFIFGMALGEDYNILVMSRIREEAHHSKSLFEAVTKAIGITGTTVTSAGLILAGTFTILGITGGNEQVQQIGFGIAFGILLDTFFVRTLLIPTVVALLGKWNWWPSKLSSK